MEIVYLVLILVFLCWIVQMLMVFRKQVDQVTAQNQQIRESQGEVLEQAERLESAAKEKADMLKDLQVQLQKLGETESGLQSEIVSFKGAEASRRPTRHRVEGNESDEES